MVHQFLASQEGNREMAALKAEVGGLKTQLAELKATLSKL